jgi:hypothetical protein
VLLGVFFQHLLPLVFQQKNWEILGFFFWGLSSVILTIFSNFSENFTKFSNITKFFYKKKPWLGDLILFISFVKILKFAKKLLFSKEQNFVRENKEMISLTNYLLIKKRLHLIN